MASLRLQQLPAFGIGEDQTFDSLKSDNPLLFRLHTVTPRRKPSFEARDGGQGRGFNIPQAVKHLNGYRHPEFRSPYVSCTFSLPYIIWEGCRRVAISEHTSEEDLYVSFIDASALEPETARLGVELLRNADLSDEDTQRAYNYANAHQEVLVQRRIPSEAIRATVPWKDIIDALRQARFMPTLRPAEQANLRKFCWKLLTYWTRRPGRGRRMTARVAADQAVKWLLFEIHVAESRRLDRAKLLAQDLAEAIYLWPRRWIIKRDFQPRTRLPQTNPTREFVESSDEFQVDVVGRLGALTIE